MDCLIRVIKGPDEGGEHRLRAGENIVGRGMKAQIRLAAGTISAEHAVITLNGDEAHIENLSANGTFVNGNKIAGKVRLRPRDQVRLAPEAIFRFEAAAGAGAGLLARKPLLITVFVLAILGVAFLIVDPFSAPTRGENWPGAYESLAGWIQQETAAQRLPRRAHDLFLEAWRLDQAQDFLHSKDTWLRLQLVLDSADDQEHFAEASLKNPKALTYLVVGPPAGHSLQEDERAAALVQFVKNRHINAATKPPPKGLAP